MDMQADQSLYCQEKYQTCIKHNVCFRKRKGGIKLEGETEEEVKEEEPGNKELEEEIAKETEQRKEEQEKKKADDLWSNFMSDVGKAPPKKTSGSGLGSLTSVNRVSYVVQ